MEKMLISYRNHVDEATFSGGSWEANLPVSNLSDPQPSKVARTQSTSAADTVLTLDLGSSRPLRFFALVQHNLTQSGRWRLRVSNNADMSEPLVDTGFIDIWPEIMPFGVGEFGEFQWGGKLGAEEAETYGISAHYVLSTSVLGRYVQIDLDDEVNPAGYIQAGRLVIGPAWTPSLNLQYGWSIQQIDESTSQRSRGGQTYVDAQPKYRRLRFTVSQIERDEMFGAAYELERLKGVGGDVLIMVDPDDLVHRHRHTIYGRMAETSPVVNASFGRFSKSFTVEEML